jgi:adenylate cyclase
VDDGVGQNIDDLLDGLDGTARTERAELIEWLLEQGITTDEIRATNPPLLLASRHLIGGDGTFVSAREISDSYGIELMLLQRVQRAIGLARVDDPDAAVHMRADGEAAAYAQRFVELGLNPDQVVLVVRVLAEGLSRAAEVMRYTALSSIMRPGASEVDIAKASKVLVSQIAPMLGPMIQDMLFMQLRHMMETEAVNAGERAAGKPLPGAREVTVAFADLVGFTRLGEVPACQPACRSRARRNRSAGAIHQDDRRRGDARLSGADAVVGYRAEACRNGRQRQRLSPAAGRSGIRHGGEPGR